MENLEPYRQRFEQEYPQYADGEYAEISDMIDALPTVDIANASLNPNSSGQILALILPLIKIKNYKSQIPFPIAIYEAVRVVIEIKNMDLTKEDARFDDAPNILFRQLLDIEGFQLPTVSAVFHFCHPGLYPIVDRNIESACKQLKELYSEELGEAQLPKLPASSTSDKNKWEKYRSFTTFLDIVNKLQNVQHQTAYIFRDLDKALMVYGVPKMREAIDGN